MRPQGTEEGKGGADGSGFHGEDTSDSWSSEGSERPELDVDELDAVVSRRAGSSMLSAAVGTSSFWRAMTARSIRKRRGSMTMDESSPSTLVDTLSEAFL